MEGLSSIFNWYNYDTRLYEKTNRRNRVNSNSEACGSSHKINQNYKDVCTRLRCVIDYINVHAGNVISIIAKDLTGPGGEEELKLLPRLYGLPRLKASNFQVSCHMANNMSSCGIFPIFDKNISDDCVDMMKKKIGRAQMLLSHQMSIDKTVDLSTHYKPLDFDSQHHHPTPSQVRYSLNLPRGVRPPPAPEPERRGGFYTTVPRAMLDKLAEMAKMYDIWVEVVLEARAMTREQVREHEVYLRERRERAERVEREREEGARREEEREWRVRRENTLGRGGLGGWALDSGFWTMVLGT
ncbi:hypothetical protein BS50DRAFT_591309 [Corynespora cassiicola Philippines]|uniref:Uncharacterized protein n=1 Tax=Corynespora cassiicola Philippines TaxID=1448308 RepID=A0A2T2NCF0_CORCC|nr:hypothetical protein BS50DRAFT_591309 [Corynespora cassiicola Philippines]